MYYEFVSQPSTWHKARIQRDVNKMTTPAVSFEFFPPRNLDASFRLWNTARALTPLQPYFVSVTYGAGGTTRQLTHEAVSALTNHYGLNVAAHLTCVDASRDETMQIVEEYTKVGVREIVALRGDAPQGQKQWMAHPEGFASSIDLVKAIAARGDITVRVGAYPEPHPDSGGSTAADIDFLKRKIDAGASSAITQFFFNPDTFFRFRDACAKAGISAPILPGILPIQSWNGTRKFAERCGTSVPQWAIEAFDNAGHKGEAQLAHDLCVKLCRDLMTGGVEKLHFYTLNKPDLTLSVCRDLGVRENALASQMA